MRIKKVVGGFNLMYNRYYNGSVYQPQLLQFIQIGTDSLTGMANQSISASINTHYNNFTTHLSWATTLGFYSAERQIIQNKITKKGNISNFYFNNRITKKRGNLFFLEWATNINLSKFKVPVNSGSQPIGTTGNFFTQIKNSWKIKPWLNLQCTPEYFIQNIGTPQKLHLFMIDAEAVFSVPKKPYSFRLNAENLTNQRFYSRVLNEGIQSQYVLDMPLIGRNLLFSIRYEL